EAALIASTNATIHLFPRATASAEAGTDCASLGTLAEERVCERCGSLTEDGQTLCDPAREDCKMCAAMAAANLSAEMDDPFAYAWYLRSVDADGDGIPDVHPILGPSAASYEEATKWITPMVILKRQRSALEQEAGIPETLLIPAVSLSFVGVIGLPKRVTDLPVPLMIPPVAAVQTHPTDAACRIPYLAPGNSVNAYQRITSECQELPTGLYSVNVLQGVAGGEPLPEAHLLPTDVTCVGPRDTPSTTPPITVHCPEPYLCLGGSCILGPPTNTGWDISADGLFSSQAWSIPNELGYADADSLPAGFELLNIPAEDPQIATEFAYPSEQGYAGMFIVHDADPSSLVSRLNPGTTPGADCVQANDLADGLDIFVDLSFPDFLGEGEPFGRTQAQQREYCCAAIMHLCDVPLCPAVEYGPDGLTIYGSPSSVDADGVPNCVPFEMPGACCGATP
ncbi:MAG: hypothetical protein OEY14_03300, partial [Myxococcales bacterium]|nr:hypothetical protein [Myxococcales bacterium]